MVRKIAGAVLFFMIFLLGAQDKPACADGHKYVGVNKCKICHMSEAKGNQYKHWAESAHAKAYATLATDEAKKTAQAAGLAGDPQKADQCLRCHVTAFGVQAELKEETFNMTDGVQCESCHGPGGDYKTLTIMKDKPKAIEAGLIMPTEEVCVKCHNPESPMYKEFNFEESFKKIAHPLIKS